MDMATIATCPRHVDATLVGYCLTIWKMVDSRGIPT